MWHLANLPMVYGSADTDKTPYEKSNLKDQISLENIKNCTSIGKLK